MTKRNDHIRMTKNVQNESLPSRKFRLLHKHDLSAGHGKAKRLTPISMCVFLGSNTPSPGIPIPGWPAASWIKAATSLAARTTIKRSLSSRLANMPCTCITAVRLATCAKRSVCPSSSASYVHGVALSPALGPVPRLLPGWCPAA